MTINIYVVTDIEPRSFTRLIPGGDTEWRGMRFSFGLSPPRETDILIVFTYDGWTIPTSLPRNRTAFVGGEPETARRYSTNFLNQFGCVAVAGERHLDTISLQEGMKVNWFFGYDFENPENSINFDQIANYKMPEKDNRISIVTSQLDDLPFHRKRLKIISHLKQMVPDQVVHYGKGTHFVADKKDALLPHRYHLALENNDEPWSWTEKLADPLLAYSFPLYLGCSNVEKDLPANAILRLDSTNPETAAKQAITAVENDLWSQRIEAIAEARNLVLHHHNLISLFARIAERLMSSPPIGPNIMLRSQRFLPPDSERKAPWTKRFHRHILLAIDPEHELRQSRQKSPLRHFN